MTIINRIIVVTVSTLALMLSVAGCSHNPVDDALRMAESEMDYNPEGALALLDSIDETSIIDGERNATYALLLTQARNKCYIDETNDSLITVALTYFEKNGSKDNFMKSAFYKAQILYYGNDYRESIIWAMKANELAKLGNDDYWVAKSAELLGNIFSESYNPADEIKYFTEASYYYGESGRKRNQLFSLCDLAIAYCDVEAFNRSQDLLDSVERVVSSPPADSVIIGYCIRSSISNYIGLGKYDDAQKCVWRLRELTDCYQLSSSDYVDIAEVYSVIGRNDSVLYFMDLAERLSATRYDTAMIKSMTGYFSKKNGDYKEALINIEYLLDHQNKTVRDILKQSVVVAQRDYYNARSRDASHEASRFRFMFFVGVSIAAFILLVGIVFYRQRIRLKNSEIESRMSEILVLSERVNRQKEDNLSLLTSIKDMDDDISSRKKLIDDMFNDMWKTINNLCDEYFEKGDSSVTRSSIVNDVEREIQRVCGPSGMAEIESLVNSCRDNAVLKLSRQCPFFKDDDIKFITLLYAGFTPRAVCLFTGIKLKYYYNRRSRLRDRILESNAPDKEYFVSIMR